MNEQSLAYRTFKNISYSVFSFGWMLVFSIFITPFVVKKLGVELYGIYVLVLTVTSLMGLFDLGIGNILVKYIAEYHARNDEKKMKELMYSFNLILFFIGIFGLTCLALIGYFAHDLFPNHNIQSGYFFSIFFLSGLIFFIGGLSTLFSVVPVALQRYDTSTKIGLINMTFVNLTMVLIVYLGYGLRAIFLSQLIYTILSFIVFRHYSKKILPQTALKFAWHWAEVKNAYKFGIATYMSNAANSALTYLDRLLIPIFLGPAALSYYTLPGSIAGKIPSVINTLSGIVFPMISSLNGLNDMEKIKNIYRRAFKLLTVVSFSITISIVLFADKILHYWLGVDFSEKSGKVLIILAFTYFFLSLGGTLNFFLLGLSKTKFLFQASFAMALTNVILLFILLPKFGIVGAAWAYLLSVLPIIYMFYYTEKNFLGLNGRLLENFKAYSKLAAVSIVFVFICNFAILPLVSSLKAVIIFGPLSVLLFLAIYWIFRFYDNEDLNAIRGFLTVVFRKFNFSK